MNRIGFGQNSFSLNRLGFSTSAVNPDDAILALFAGGKQGVWYDPSDLSTLFQDAAGTVPVTANGDPDGRMLDKSGNGNHMSQSISASRPAYTKDGNLDSLYFDGVDDMLVATLARNMSESGELYVFAAFKGTPDADEGILAELGYNYMSYGGFYLVSRATYSAFSGRGARIGDSTDEVNQYVASTANILTATINVNKITPAKARVNNGEWVNSITTDFGGGVMSKDNLHVGNRLDGLLPFKGHLYGLIIVGGAMTEQEIIDTQNYLATKAGVTL